MCKLASDPKFISQMQGIDLHTLTSKMKGKQMISNQNQLHEETQRPPEGKGQTSTDISAQVSILCYRHLLDPNSPGSETASQDILQAILHLEMETDLCGSKHGYPPSVSWLHWGVAWSCNSSLMWLQHSCNFIDLSKNSTPV